MLFLPFHDLISPMALICHLRPCGNTHISSHLLHTAAVNSQERKVCNFISYFFIVVINLITKSTKKKRERKKRKKAFNEALNSRALEYTRTELRQPAGWGRHNLKMLKAHISNHKQKREHPGDGMRILKLPSLSTLATHLLYKATSLILPKEFHKEENKYLNIWGSFLFKPPQGGNHISAIIDGGRIAMYRGMGNLLN